MTNSAIRINEGFWQFE